MNFRRWDYFEPIRGQTLMIALAVSLPCAGFAQSLRLDSAGVRASFYSSGAGRDFHQAEGFVNWDLPWDWDLGSHWHLGSRLEASAGWLGESGADAAIFSGGPSLWLNHGQFPLSLEGGLSPTVLTRSDFRTKDFGVPFQFTSHVGLNLDIASKVRLSYRFQHMSNAGLSNRNPGLNLHMFGVSYLF